MSYSLEAQQRPDGAKPNALRREGLIPANLYGHDGAQSVQFVLNEKDLIILLRKVTVNETPIEVNIPHLSWKGTAVIREIQSHPWKRTLNHLSFFAVKAA
jgi:large subunit ribosomal protein L25